MNEFCGVFPATITPMKPDGELDETTFRQILEFNIQAGVHGFWLAGGTGESILLDDEENQRIAKIAVDQVRGRVTTIMHVGAPTTSRGAKLAQHAARVGIDSICCLPPFPYGQTDQEIVEHLRVIAAAADLPFFVYNVPTLTGIEVTPELMTKIQESVPKLVGLKHSAFNLLNVQIFAKMGLSCLIGFGSLMLPALTIGASGCVDGPPNFAPELWVEIWSAYQAGDLKRAEAAQDKAASMYGFLLRHGYLACLKP